MIQNNFHRVFIRLCYLLPAILGVFLLIYALIPHLWFVFNREAHETMSLFALQGNAWELSQSVLTQGSAVSPSERLFANILTWASILFWVLMVLYILFAVMAAVCSTLAFASPPTASFANKTKRFFHLFCPNRVCFLLFSLLPVLCSLFPELLLICYRLILNYEMRLHSAIGADWIYALIFAAVTGATFVFTLPWQSEEHMDLYRIYRANSFDKERNIK